MKAVTVICVEPYVICCHDKLSLLAVRASGMLRRPICMRADEWPSLLFSGRNSLAHFTLFVYALAQKVLPFFLSVWLAASAYFQPHTVPGGHIGLRHCDNTLLFLRPHTYIHGALGLLPEECLSVRLLVRQQWWHCIAIRAGQITGLHVISLFETVTNFPAGLCFSADVYFFINPP